MRIVNVKQGSPEWLKVRVGRITASRMGDVVAKRQKGSEELARRRDYRMELVCERLTGRAADHYVSPDMDRGTEREPHARAAYEIAMGAIVDEVGFILHPNMDFSGASPDSLVDSDGGLEIKAPKTATHLEWMEAGVVPEEHRPQMYWNMACSGRDWWDFLSFDDRLPSGLRIFCCRLQRDDKIIAGMEYEAVQFNTEIEDKCRALNAIPVAPFVPRIASTETVRIGALDVPIDIAELVGGEIMP